MINIVEGTTGLGKTTTLNIVSKILSKSFKVLHLYCEESEEYFIEKYNLLQTNVCLSVTMRRCENLETLTNIIHEEKDIEIIIIDYYECYFDCFRCLVDVSKIKSVPIWIGSQNSLLRMNVDVIDIYIKLHKTVEMPFFELYNKSFIDINFIEIIIKERVHFTNIKGFLDFLIDKI